jgi:hypothetical protein
MAGCPMRTRFGTSSADVILKMNHIGPPPSKDIEGIEGIEGRLLEIMERVKCLSVDTCSATSSVMNTYSLIT